MAKLRDLPLALVWQQLTALFLKSSTHCPHTANKVLSCLLSLLSWFPVFNHPKLLIQTFVSFLPSWHLPPESFLSLGSLNQPIYPLPSLWIPCLLNLPWNLSSILLYFDFSCPVSGTWTTVGEIRSKRRLVSHTSVVFKLNWALK